MNKPTNTPGLAVRVKSPRRLQKEIRMLALEELIREDHPVRDVWRYVQSLDLSPLYAKIQAVKGAWAATRSIPAFAPLKN
jgi:hypothetical protein